MSSLPIALVTSSITIGTATMPSPTAVTRPCSITICIAARFRSRSRSAAPPHADGDPGCSADTAAASVAGMPAAAPAHTLSQYRSPAVARPAYFYTRRLHRPQVNNRWACCPRGVDCCTWPRPLRWTSCHRCRMLLASIACWLCGQLRHQEAPRDRTLSARHLFAATTCLPGCAPSTRNLLRAASSSVRLPKIWWVASPDFHGLYSAVFVTSAIRCGS